MGVILEICVHQFDLHPGSTKHGDCKTCTCSLENKYCKGFSPMTNEYLNHIGHEMGAVALNDRLRRIGANIVYA